MFTFIVLCLGIFTQTQSIFILLVFYKHLLFDKGT